MNNLDWKYFQELTFGKINDKRETLIARLDLRILLNDSIKNEDEWNILIKNVCSSFPNIEINISIPDIELDFIINKVIEDYSDSFYFKSKIIYLNKLSENKKKSITFWAILIIKKYNELVFLDENLKLHQLNMDNNTIKLIEELIENQRNPIYKKERNIKFNLAEKKRHLERLKIPKHIRAEEIQKAQELKEKMLSLNQIKQIL